MFRLGRQVESALLAIRVLNEAFEKDVSISDICLKFNLSKNTLSKVMQSLSNYKLIKSSQGTKGGYRLLQPLNKISFFQVLDSLGEIKNLSCRKDNSCSIFKNCSISSPLIQWERSFENHLKNTFLNELLYENSTYSNNPLTLNRNL